MYYMSWYDFRYGSPGAGLSLRVVLGTHGLSAMYVDISIDTLVLGLLASVLPLLTYTASKVA